jgi:hypothetical protein
MDLWEFIIIVIILGAIIFLIYYYLRGSTGKVSLTRPVESRVDEYLDRRFESLIAEWELVTRPKLQSFKERKQREIEQDESRLADVKGFEADMQSSLEKLEARLDAVEKDLAPKGILKK